MTHHAATTYLVLTMLFVVGCNRGDETDQPLEATSDDAGVASATDVDSQPSHSDAGDHQNDEPMLLGELVPIEGGINLNMSFSQVEGLKMISVTVADSDEKRVELIVENPKENIIRTGFFLTESEIGMIGQSHFTNDTIVRYVTTGDGVVGFSSVDLSAAHIPESLEKALKKGGLARDVRVNLVFDAKRARFLLIHEERDEFTVIQIKRPGDEEEEAQTPPSDTSP